MKHLPLSTFIVLLNLYISDTVDSWILLIFWIFIKLVFRDDNFMQKLQRHVSTNQKKLQSMTKIMSGHPLQMQQNRQMFQKDSIEQIVRIKETTVRKPGEIFSARLFNFRVYCDFSSLLRFSKKFKRPNLIKKLSLKTDFPSKQKQFISPNF